MSTTITKLSFSGHESFQCRNLWLKKGYDYVMKGKSFNAEDAVVELGVGKNMVASIRYWMRVFDLLKNDDTPTELAHKLLADDGYDPYLEDVASLWILHFHLVTKGQASIYSLVFNELRRERIEFTKDNFIAFIKRKAENLNISVNENTVNDDFGVMAKMYLRGDTKDKDESFSGILTELDFLRLKVVHYKEVENGKEKDRKQDYYVIENDERPTLPDAVVLYGLLQQSGTDVSISFNMLEQDPNQVGSVFALSRAGLLNKIENISEQYSDIIFSDQAGIRELQFKNIKPDPFQILDDYYGQ